MNVCQTIVSELSFIPNRCLQFHVEILNGVWGQWYLRYFFEPLKNGLLFFSLLNLNYFSPCHGLVTFVPYPFELLFKLFGIVLLICCPPWNPSMPKSGPVHLFPCTPLGSHLPAFPAASWSAAHLDVINLQCFRSGLHGCPLDFHHRCFDDLRWSGVFGSNLGLTAEFVKHLAPQCRRRTKGWDLPFDPQRHRSRD